MSPKSGLPNLEDELELHSQRLGLRPQTVPSSPPPAPPAPQIVIEPEEDGAELADLEADKPLSKALRRKLPKSRTGTFARPYPGLKRDTVKTAMNLSIEARKELDVFFARLGPGKRNLWIERVLLTAARRATRHMDERAAQEAELDEMMVAQERE